MSTSLTVDTVYQPDRTTALGVNAAKRKRFRRRKKIIKPAHQLKLACFVVIFLLIYTLLFGTAIYYPLAMELRGSVTIGEEGRAALVILGLHETIWPALLFVLVLSFVGTILFSHRVVGPIYRLERAAEDFVKMDFKRIRLRKNDEFKEIEISVNKIADYLSNIQAQDSQFHSHISINLSQISKMLENKTEHSIEEVQELVNEIIEELGTKPHAFTLNH
ncbi:MAG: methyl-accepting chemotaxis protein [Deltaproteobacteria bacterium]|nr:methyl-accepting chemotaxis protein [Deltaproteobacteria bacterium]